MEFADALRRRHMVRRYTGQPVHEGSIDRIIHAGKRAPSAGNAQGTRFVVVTDAEQRSRIATCADENRWVAAGKDPWLSIAPAHIVLLVDPTAYADRYDRPDKASSTARNDDGTWEVPWWWVDAGASLMSMLLATEDEGLGAGFLGAHAFEGLNQLLGVPDHFELVGVMTVGHPHPDDSPTGSALLPGPEESEVVCYERWDAS